MKISFVRIENDKLPEPYKGLTTNILYLTNTGYVYPEGSDAPIDIFPPNILRKITTNPFTELQDKPKVQIPEIIDEELVLQYINKYKELLATIKIQTRTGIENLTRITGLNVYQTKEILTTLVQLKIIEYRGGWYRLGNELKDIVVNELENKI